MFFLFYIVLEFQMLNQWFQQNIAVLKLISLSKCQLFSFQEIFASLQVVFYRFLLFICFFFLFSKKHNRMEIPWTYFMFFMLYLVSFMLFLFFFFQHKLSLNKYTFFSPLHFHWPKRLTAAPTLARPKL